MSARWHQFIAVRGDALRLLEHISNVVVTDRSNTVVIRGSGDYFPEFRGAEWAAMCVPCPATDVTLNDIRPILDVLIRETPLAVTDTARDEVEKFMKGAG